MRLGVLGGSFNPVHKGHLHIALEAQAAFGLTRVMFVVATHPPHKRRERLVAFTHRYAMVGLATSGLPSLVPSPVELEPPASAFSIDTLAKLARSHDLEPHRMYFIAGADSLLDVVNWRRSRDLLRRCNFIFVSRPGCAVGDPASVLPAGRASRVLDLRGTTGRAFRARIEGAGREAEPRIFIADLRAPDISASRIRERVAARRPIRRWVPAPVAEYIDKLDLYGAR
ncbi:MAG: nicotinate (nicotinamide) nucleotide adenylyltransferase [Acidobacteria bacterium]|nr:nicotinate (nicotinamide) nucleotide adenylyltransferase [Acidobacteriota bacterium]